MGRFALVRKKERWSATWLGNLLKVVVLLLLVFIYGACIRSFLAPVKPVPSNVMVVEGFLTDYGIEEAMVIFKRDHYDLMLITGKKRIKGAHLDHFENDGDYSAAAIEKLGFDMNQVRVVEVEFDITKDRTYYSALAVGNWLKEHKPSCTSLNLVTLGCHGKRSKYLFQTAVGDSIDVGIISVVSRSYDPKRWWTSSFGFREVTKETLAWIYARFFFFPSE